MSCSKSSAEREFHSNTSLPQETRETSNKQANLTSKATGKEQQQKQKNLRVSRRKEIIKIKEEISEKEIK